MITRSPRYYVSCAYVQNISQDKTYFGSLEEKLMSSVELDYLLKILSPSNCWGWIENVKRLNRRDSIFLNIKDNDLVKIVKIRKS